MKPRTYINAIDHLMSNPELRARREDWDDKVLLYLPGMGVYLGSPDGGKLIRYSPTEEDRIATNWIVL